MSNRYKQITSGDNVRFTRALFGEAERSRMLATPTHLTTFNAGDIVPIYCKEILPSEEISMDLDFVIRQTTLLTPTMGSMHVDIYAFFVPNRIVNQSWPAVEGENLSGSWTAPQVSLAPLVYTSSGSVQVPPGSVADYYGFPTQQSIPRSVLSLCHDLKFRGYVMIWNEHFRDQNYQPPIPLSTLNVYQGFFDDRSLNLRFTDSVSGLSESTIDSSVLPDGSYGAGSVVESVYGTGSGTRTGPSVLALSPLSDHFYALSSPLKANKMHDYFTSVLPSPQKSQSSVFAPASGQISSVPVVTASSEVLSGVYPSLKLRISSTGGTVGSATSLGIDGNSALAGTNGTAISSPSGLFPSNLMTADGATVTGLGISVDDLRMAAAIQQVYEIQARGGSRYREIVQSFFGITADDPFSNIPRCLGHISRDLDLYQTAQTSSSETGNTPQGNLAAFGYTSSNGHLFHSTFVEHGYLHIFAVVRQRNIYASMLDRDNFRLSMLDYYLPPLANISEQPVYTYQINPFASDPTGVFGYQEAWAEYRYEPDRVTGLMRPGVSESLSLWNYADDFDSNLVIATGSWLQSNAQSVLDRTLAVTSSVAPQFKGQFKFFVDKTLPMPTYSVPGMDII